jgi:hypothetical protein
MGKNNLNKKLYEMMLSKDRLGSTYRILQNSTYGSGLDTYGLVYDITNPFDESISRSDYDRARDKARAEREARIARFATHGKEMSNAAMAKYIAASDDAERPIKLRDICFGHPLKGLVGSRPDVYGVISVHYIAGHKILIKRFDDSSDDTVWYETPISTYHCTFDKLEEIIHEQLLEAIQRDSKWDKIK